MGQARGPMEALRTGGLGEAKLELVWGEEHRIYLEAGTLPQRPSFLRPRDPSCP